MPLKHKPAEFQKLKAEKATAKAEHGQGNSVPALRDRVDRLEVLVAVVKPA